MNWLICDMMTSTFVTDCIVDCQQECLRRKAKTLSILNSTSRPSPFYKPMPDLWFTTEIKQLFFFFFHFFLSFENTLRNNCQIHFLFLFLAIHSHTTLFLNVCTVPRAVTCASVEEQEGQHLTVSLTMAKSTALAAIPGYDGRLGKTLNDESKFQQPRHHGLL